MTGFLLDTDVASEAMKKDRHPAVQSWRERQFGEANLFISVVTLGEIRYGLHRMPVSGKRRELEVRFELKVAQEFYNRVLPVTDAIAERWAIFRASRESIGRPLSITDGMIAATAHEMRLTMVTRNVRDFEHLGLTILNPFEFIP